MLEQSGTENSETDDDNNFLFDDIRDELESYQKISMSSFQRINFFFNQITNKSLSDYLNNIDEVESVETEEYTSDHMFFCQQVKLSPTQFQTS